MVTVECFLWGMIDRLKIHRFEYFGGDDWRERQSATFVVAWMSPRFRTMVR
jgi:hypothetical protein